MVLQRGDVVCAKVEALSEEERTAFENDGIVMRRAVGGVVSAWRAHLQSLV